MRGEVVERMPGLVNKRVHVVRNADGIHEDERPAAETELRAVAAWRFVLPALEIEKPFVRHERELATELPVHTVEDRLCPVDERGHILERSQRLHPLELDAQVPRPNAVQTEPLAAIFELPLDGGDDGPLDGVVEPRAIRGGVVEPVLRLE